MVVDAASLLEGSTTTTSNALISSELIVNSDQLLEGNVFTGDLSIVFSPDTSFGIILVQQFDRSIDLQQRRTKLMRDQKVINFIER